MMPEPLCFCHTRSPNRWQGLLTSPWDSKAPASCQRVSTSLWGPWLDCHLASGVLVCVTAQVGGGVNVNIQGVCVQV